MRLHEDAKQPIRAYETDSGWDIFCVEDLDLPAASHMNISSGIAIEVKAGWSYDVRGRSGLNRVGVIAALGLCDAHYVNEIRVVLSNLSGDHYRIKKGERVGQIKLNPVWDMPWQEVKKFNPKPGTRAMNGWGSSGR
jgi:dUTP pyrophosphatase